MGKDKENDLSMDKSVSQENKPVESCLYEMNSFPLPHGAFPNVGHHSYTDVPLTNPPPQYPHSPHVSMGLLDPGGGNFLPHYQRLSPLPQVESAYDREERFSVQTYASFPPCEVSVVSSSPDVDSETMPSLTCIMPPHHPQQELCPPAGNYGPPPTQSHEIGQQHLLYTSGTGTAGPFSSPSDSMLSESDLEGFQNGNAADSPRSTSSTSSPLHHNSASGKQQQQPPSALGPPVLRSNQYKSVITATNLQTPPGTPSDFINTRLAKQQQQQQYQQRTFASCSPANSPYNDSCFFETARQQQTAQPHMDSSIKYALSKCDSYADKAYCVTSTNGASEYNCTADGVQPQYTSVIVDAQQYQQMANGFVH